MKKYITSESVTEGHPDKVCDQISDKILDTALSQDKKSKMAVECTIKDNLIFIYGESSTKAKIPYEKIAKEVIKEIGYNEEYEGERREDCYVCGKTNNERKKIVCSMCNYNVCHYTCDGLKEMPRDRWYCRDCKLVIKEQKSMRKKIGRLYVN